MMRLILGGADGPPLEVIGGKPGSLKRVHPISSLFRGIVLVAGVIVISASALAGEERPHPSLVDPAITKCTVCHTNLSAVHAGGASSENCLSCHTMVKKSKKTYLIVDDGQPELTDEALPPVSRGGESEPGEDQTPRSPTAAGQPDPPAVETIAVVAAAQPTDQSENLNLVTGSGDAADTGRLYSEGMAAFNRGDFDDAFHAWRLMFTGSPDLYALQIEVDTLFVSAQSTLARYRDHSLYIVKKDDLYWVFSGLFTSEAKAAEALKLLPEALRQGGAFPIEVRQIAPPH